MIAKPAMRRLLLVGIEPVSFHCGRDDGPVRVDEFLAVQQRPGDVVDVLLVGVCRRRCCVTHRGYTTVSSIRFAKKRSSGLAEWVSDSKSSMFG
jgi:hypothetical protein